ncbi:hypothetical protein AWC38_SpisGene10637 [Stylophora pistillata]|uniref:Uncharacterized protein n=1 Tax=Stylophora pistillata TaxID=50429 RepID=A0A2B4S8B3_STYPI|nr:hypothetical protein AWC38_SpisGene10637 [Stylophora pistillata]
MSLLKKTSQTSDIGYNRIPTIDSLSITTNGVAKQLSLLKTNKASGLDAISPWFLKEHAAEIAPIQQISSKTLSKVELYPVDGNWQIVNSLFHHYCDTSLGISIEETEKGMVIFKFHFKFARMTITGLTFKIKALKQQAMFQFATDFNATQHDEAQAKNLPPHPNKPGFTKPLVVVHQLKIMA